MKKILVLDDSPFMLTVVGDLLSGLNYDVTTVDNGEAAYNKVEETRYDLIITDMNMPGMDGLEFTRRVRTLPNCKFVPIVMLSSEEDRDRIDRARQLGISTFISKPPKETQLQNILQIILNKRGAPRIPVQIKISYGADAECTGVTSNMSTTGLFLETAAPLSPGQKVELTLPLPGTMLPISCQARVAWVFTDTAATERNHPPGMGLEFLDRKHESQIKAFLESVA